jgi:hypothetical protein
MFCAPTFALKVANPLRVVAVAREITTKTTTKKG